MKPIEILGGGLAGLLVASELHAAGHHHIHIIHSPHPLAGSGAPLALLHPFPGRSLQPHPLLLEAWDVALETAKRWQRYTPALVRELPMVRPCIGRGGKRLIKSFNKYWSNNPKSPWNFSLRSAQRQTQDMDGKGALHGTLQYSPAFAVALHQVCIAETSRLMAEGVHFSEGRPENLSGSGTQILCVGPRLNHFFPQLKLREEGGELSRFKVSKSLTTMISGSGFHAAPWDETHIIGGSTRWTDSPPYPTHEASGQLAVPMSALLPDHEPTPTPLSWRGVRAIHASDRLPIVGAVPGGSHTWVLGGLGSKGLLWGPYAARLLVQAILAGQEVPHPVSTRRLPLQFWSRKKH